MSETSTDLQVFTIMNDSSRNILLDSTFSFNRDGLIDIYGGTLPVWRFDENGTFLDINGNGGNWTLNDGKYRFYDTETEYTGNFSIDSERLILYDFTGENVSYDSINEYWVSQYIDFTFSKIQTPEGRLSVSGQKNEKFENLFKKILVK